MSMKICGKCKIEKQNDEFTFRKDTGRYESKCKQCAKDYLKEYYKNNKKIILDRSNFYYKENVEKVLSNNKKYREINSEIIKKRKVDYHVKNCEKIREKTKKWRQENKDKRNQSEKDRRKKDNLHKLIHYLRVRTNFYIRKMNIQKKDSSIEVIGCSPEFLKEHLEKKFTEGMSWDLMGKHIHIDHIIPLSSAKTEKEIYTLCHYSNLQPLWAKDNLKKSNKI